MTTKKITKTTLKSFVAKNRGNLLLLVSQRFDGMVDGVRGTGETVFTPVTATAFDYATTLGVDGLWLVGGSRNYFSAFENDEFVGFSVVNCCGKATLVVAKG